MAVFQRTIDDHGGCVEGEVADGWAPLAEEFVEGFARRGEVGASLCVEVAGKPVVDLWGGWADPTKQKPWRADTLVVVFSCSKAATAFCAHLLIDRGALDPHAPVTEYWPEFARAGKDGATVAMLLNHSVGVPGFREPLKYRAVADWDYMVGRLEEEPPFWEPGTRQGYHALTFGWTVGEVIRRVSGQSLGEFFAKEIAAPLNVEFWFGLPESAEPRVAPMLTALPSPGEPVPEFVAAATADPHSITACTMFNTGGYFDFETDADGRPIYGPNTRWAHAAQIGAGGGISNGRALARIFRPLAGCGAPMLSERQRQRMAAISTATMRDAVLLTPTRFSLGFMAAMDNSALPPGRRYSVRIAEGAFGHVGAGGSFGFADPALGLSFGYAMNQMGQGIFLNSRGQALVDAAYRCAAAAR